MVVRVAVLFLLELPLLWQSSKPANGDWPYTSGERRGSHYSPLDQIRASNVKQLGLAWSIRHCNDVRAGSPTPPDPQQIRSGAEAYHRNRAACDLHAESIDFWDGIFGRRWAIKPQ